MKNLGKRIKEIRKALGLTQEMFAIKIYIDQGYLSQIERGKKRPSALILLAIQNMFGVSREWLLAGKGPQRDFANLERALDQADDLASEQRKEFDRLVLSSKLLDGLVKMPGGTEVAIAEERLSVVHRKETEEKLLDLIETLLRDRELYVKHDDLIVPVAEVIKHTGQIAREREADEKVRAKRKGRKSSA